MDIREGLPSHSNRPTSEKGYIMASIAIEVLLRHGVLKNYKSKKECPTSIRTAIEGMVNRSGCHTYVSKGDVFSVLYDSGYVLEAQDSHHCKDMKGIAFIPGAWGALVNNDSYYRKTQELANLALIDFIKIIRELGKEED